MVEKSPSERLRNICAALEEDLNKSPFTREEWDRLDAERMELLRANDALEARLAEAEALLQETCERISEAETTSSVLTGQIPEYSEGQQMLSRLATVMGDLMKRIRAFRAADRSEDAGK